MRVIDNKYGGYALYDLSSPLFPFCLAIREIIQQVINENFCIGEAWPKYM